MSGRHPAWKRIGGTAAVAVTLAATTVFAATAPRGATGTPQAKAFTSGAVAMSNSHRDEAIFSASNLAPGGSVAGSVTIENTGTGTGSLALSPASVEDSGPRGRALYEALDLQVADVTGGSTSILYGGELGALPTLSLASLQPGSARTYRFTASLPDGGPSSDGVGDNFLQRASVSMAYEWTLTQTEPPVTEPPATPPPPALTPAPPTVVPPALRGCPTRIVGNSKGNRLFGTAGGDQIYGRGGADRIRGRGGRDCLVGGAGGDRISGGSGGDRLRGGTGNDSLTGNGGIDRILGGAGRDRIHALDGLRDLINCGSGRDAAFVDHRDRVRNCERVHRLPRR